MDIDLLPFRLAGMLLAAVAYGIIVARAGYPRLVALLLGILFIVPFVNFFLLLWFAFLAEWPVRNLARQARGVTRSTAKYGLKAPWEP